MPRPVSTNKRQLLKQISLFSDLTDPQLDFIAGRSRLVEHEKGETIYSQGDPPDAFYGLISGRVRVFVQGPGGKQEILEVLHRGDYFGTISLLTSEPHSVTAQAMNDSILLKVKRPDFDAILKEVPEVAIHLSTTLSRRLRQKDVAAKKVFESTLISIYSPLRETGRTMYAINMAASLRHETGKRVILLDVSPMGDEVCKALGVSRCPLPIHLKGVGFDQSRVVAAIVEHPSVGISTLNISHDPRVVSDVTQVTPLLSYLANLYHFVITDLPCEMDRTVFKALVQADLIHLVCDSTEDHLETTGKLIRELERTIQQAGERIRVVVNETARGVPSQERVEVLGTKVYATLPLVEAPTAPGHPIALAHPDWEYSRAVRRISREIGGVLVGLVLGSGAALGLAHIGIMKVLEREQIPIDIIAGSSIGALLGAFWASGLSSRELEQIAGEFRAKRSLVRLIDLTIPKFGIFTGRRVTKFLNRHLEGLTFRDLKIPLKVTACDYARRELVVIDDGPLVTAVRASVSIPAIFEPIKVRGRWLIDGGVLDPVPVDVLSQMGVHKMIAVNTLPSPEDIHRRHQELAEERQRLAHQAQLEGRLKSLWFSFRRAWWSWLDSNIFDVIMHTMQGMEYELAEAGCAQADVVLHPTVPRVNWFEFYSVDQLIRRGEEEAEAHLPEIKKLVFEG
ncbi:MAG: patatin-like phospholipase family protein [Candidatus Omnitrophica bacterium]|nr:patatin-like phospholipase family protein [Candidatus Omnitrophota bacterium]